MDRQTDRDGRIDGQGRENPGTDRWIGNDWLTKTDGQRDRGQGRTDGQERTGTDGRTGWDRQPVGDTMCDNSIICGRPHNDHCTAHQHFR